jgi:hypothetical protein
MRRRHGRRKNRPMRSIGLGLLLALAAFRFALDCRRRFLLYPGAIRAARRRSCRYQSECRNRWNHQ